MLDSPIEVANMTGNHGEEDTDVNELAKILLALQSPPSSPSGKEAPSISQIIETPKPIPIIAPTSPVLQREVSSPPSIALVSSEMRPTPTVLAVPAPPATPAMQSTSIPSNPQKHQASTTPRPPKRKEPSASEVKSTNKVDGKSVSDQDRKKRKRVTDEQLSILETIFATDKLPDQKLRLQLAERLGMSSRRVQIWFQNKRAKLKKARQLAAASPSSSPSSSLPSSPLAGAQQPLQQASASPTPNERTTTISLTPASFSILPSAPTNNTTTKLINTSTTTNNTLININKSNNTNINNLNNNGSHFSFAPLSFHAFPGGPHYSLPVK